MARRRYRNAGLYGAAAARDSGLRRAQDAPACSDSVAQRVGRGRRDDASVKRNTGGASATLPQHWQSQRHPASQFPPERLVEDRRQERVEFTAVWACNASSRSTLARNSSRWSTMPRASGREGTGTAVTRSRMAADWQHVAAQQRTKHDLLWTPNFFPPICRSFSYRLGRYLPRRTVQGIWAVWVAHSSCDLCARQCDSLRTESRGCCG